MRMTRYFWIVPALVAVLGAGRGARAQGERDFKPELEQLVQTVAEKVDAIGDKLGLSADQRSKIRDIHANFAEKYKAMRNERRDLLRSEWTALGSLLTPEQREKVKEFAEDRMEARKAEAAERDWPQFAEIRDTITDRIQGVAQSLGMSDEQCDKIRSTFSQFAEKYQDERARRRDLVEAEFKAIAAVLTPEQQRMAREAVEDRCVRASLVAALADRIDAAADALGLDTDQRQRIITTRRPFATKFRALRDDRRKLLRDELKAIGAVLTPEQREKIKDFDEDRVVIIAVVPDENARAEARKHLGETMADRLESVADKLGLTADQRSKIRDIHANFAEKFRDQRVQRKALRMEEMQALGPILTSAQRDKVRDWVEDRVETSREN